MPTKAQLEEENRTLRAALSEVEREIEDLREEVRELKGRIDDMEDEFRNGIPDAVADMHAFPTCVRSYPMNPWTCAACAAMK